MIHGRLLPCVLGASLGACALAGAPDPPADFVQVEAQPTQTHVEFENGTDRLSGTLYLPEVGTGVPGIVILGGSERGPRTSMKHRLARRVAGSGVAALIYDSPGTGGSTGAAILQTRDARVAEALAGVRFLASHDRVRSDSVGVAGISEGALVTLLAAAKSDDVAFAIPISGGFGSSMEDLARFRIETKGHLRGLPPDEIQRALLLEEILFALFSGPERTEWRLVGMKAAQWPDEAWTVLIESVRTARDADSAQERQSTWDAIRGALGTWRSEAWFDLVVVDVERFDRLLAMSAEQFYAFLGANPLGAGDIDKVARELVEHRKIRCPVLAVWGENDEFLPPHASAAFLRSCLDAAGHDDATFVIVPGATHILTVSNDDATFAPGYPDMVTEWISERFGVSSPP